MTRLLAHSAGAVALIFVVVLVLLSCFEHKAKLGDVASMRPHRPIFRAKGVVSLVPVGGSNKSSVSGMKNMATNGKC